MGSQHSNTTESSNSNECQNKSEERIGDCLSEEIAGATGGIESQSGNTNSSVTTKRSAKSFYKGALGVSVLCSALSQASSYVMGPIDKISISLMKLSVKYRNLNCLMKNVLDFGEKNLYSLGINIRSELGRVGTSPEEMMSKQRFLQNQEIISGTNLNDINGTIAANIEKEIGVYESKYYRIKEVVLSISERIKEFSPFDIQSRYRLGNHSALVRTNDLSYYPCPSVCGNSHGCSNINIYPHENDDSMATERTVLIIIIFTSILALFYFFVMSSKKLKIFSNRSKNNRLRNTNKTQP